MAEYKTIKIVIEAEVKPDADVDEIAADMVATAEDRFDVLAAWKND